MKDPRAVRFIDWWERNEEKHIPAGRYWFDLFDAWTEGMSLNPRASFALFEECSDEYHERQWRRAQREPQGMIVTDLSQWEEAA
jgi:hypothetical protein